MTNLLLNLRPKGGGGEEKRRRAGGQGGEGEGETIMKLLRPLPLHSLVLHP